MRVWRRLAAVVKQSFLAIVRLMTSRLDNDVLLCLTWLWCSDFGNPRPVRSFRGKQWIFFLIHHLAWCRGSRSVLLSPKGLIELIVGTGRVVQGRLRIEHLTTPGLYMWVGTPSIADRNLSRDLPTCIWQCWQRPPFRVFNFGSRRHDLSNATFCQGILTIGQVPE